MTQPMIGVHLLTEFVFCARAGLCTRDTDPEEERPAPANLNFLPDWDEREIEFALHERANRAFRWIAGAVAAMIAAYVLELLKTKFWPWLAITVSATCFIVCGLACWDAIVLFSRLLAARRAKPREPDLAGPEEQRIDWWELRKAGYLPVKNDAPYVDEGLGLLGRPWRVLRLGSRSIPVFCRDDDGPIRFQHRVRIAAYCHLLTVCEGGESPFGIVLNRSTRKGVALLIEPGKALGIFHGSLKQARRVIRNNDDGEWPSAPKATLCYGCPHGKPVLAQEPFCSNGIPLEMISTVGGDGRNYHSRCGDRFGEIPPHEKALRLGLC